MIYLEKKCNLLGMKNLFYSLMSGTINNLELMGTDLKSVPIN